MTVIGTSGKTKPTKDAFGKPLVYSRIYHRIGVGDPKARTYVLVAAGESLSSELISKYSTPAGSKKKGDLNEP